MTNLWTGTGSASVTPNSVTTALLGGSVNTQGAASSYSTNQGTTSTPTNLIRFSPSDDANFQFQATFDGDVYNVIVTWNIYGERYYINIYDLNNNLILCFPLIGSPIGDNISLTAGYFATQLVYRVPNQQFEVI